MPHIIENKTKKSVEVSEGDDIRNACEELGVPFGCRDGICGTCMIDVVSGKDNLSPLHQKEKDLQRDESHRLACQCRIKKGDVNIDF
jgi:ferredoxin